MKNVWMMSVVGLLVVAFSAPAFAGCFEDVEVSSFMIEVTPETECLTLDLVGNECVGGADLVVTNDCADDLVVLFPKEEEGTFYSQTINAGTTGNVRINRDGDSTSWERTANLGAQELTIKVEYESRVTNTYEGCSVSGSASLVPFALLGIAGFRRRRRA